MRKVTIKRTKSFVGCLAKLKIYIEDPTSNEIRINGTPCRKLGDIRNGEEKNFLLGEHEAKIFVISDRLSKSYCNEYYQLPEGSEDIFLSGAPKLNPAGGNAFRFDNNKSEEIIALRKRNTLKGMLVLIAAAVAGLFIGYSVSTIMFSAKAPSAKVFHSNGMVITLTDEFEETEHEKYTVVYGSRSLAVFALKESFSLAEGFQYYSLDQYAELVLQNNSHFSSDIKKTDGLTCFEYDFTNPDTNDTYRYFSFVYKSNDAFWLVQFVTLAENAEEYRATVFDWAKVITFEAAV